MTPGHPGRSQAAKLGLKPGQRVRLHNPPDGWALSDPPAGLADPGPDGPADVIVAFFTRAGEIGEQIGELARRIYPAGALWVAWPRRAAGHRSDITDTVIRSCALPIGLVDVKVAAIDHDWSGLRVVWRTEHRRLGPNHDIGATSMLHPQHRCHIDVVSSPPHDQLELISAGGRDRRARTMAPWVSLDAESPHFRFSPSRSRSSSPTNWLTGPREPRSRLSGTT